MTKQVIDHNCKLVTNLFDFNERLCDEFFYSKPYAAAETVPVANTLHQDAFLRDLIQCHFLSIFMNFNHFHEFKYFSLN